MMIDFVLSTHPDGEALVMGRNLLPISDQSCEEYCPRKGIIFDRDVLFSNRPSLRVCATMWQCINFATRSERPTVTLQFNVYFRYLSYFLFPFLSFFFAGKFHVKDKERKMANPFSPVVPSFWSIVSLTWVKKMFDLWLELKRWFSALNKLWSLLS